MVNSQRLIDAYFDDELTDQQFGELVAWISENPANMVEFTRASYLHSTLRDVLRGDDSLGVLSETAEEGSESELLVSAKSILSMLAEDAKSSQREAEARAEIERLAAEKLSVFRREQERRSETIPVPRNPFYATVSSLAAAAILFIFWILPDPVPTPVSVASIDDSIDAQWSDPSLSTAPGTQLFTLGNLVLTRGVVQIGFEGGAKMVVEAPATLELLSPDSARLEWGRLVGHVLRSEVQLTIKTPNASVTDLGTEFGVSVDRQQVTHLHVFEGQVSAATFDSEGKTAQQQTVLVDEAVYLRPKTGVIEPAPVDAASQFARRIPVPISLPRYSTGVGLAMGDADPHWQVVAAKNDPNFVPRPAIVAAPQRSYARHDPRRSQWVSLTAKLADLPPAAQYTFRMTLNLTKSDIRPNRLRGSFSADDLVVAVRINGAAVSVPKHESKKKSVPWVVDGNLLKLGKNTLEVDVLNGGKLGGEGGSPLALRVQWEEVGSGSLIGK
ncbi:MAG: FecR domain-containing protein [Planctomycetes bacterium]|nr:FecR domain-containing protein [Planctomycetota bacterium]